LTYEDEEAAVKAAHNCKSVIVDGILISCKLSYRNRPTGRVYDLGGGAVYVSQGPTSQISAQQAAAAAAHHVSPTNIGTSYTHVLAHAHGQTKMHSHRRGPSSAIDPMMPQISPYVPQPSLRMNYAVDHGAQSGRVAAMPTTMSHFQQGQPPVHQPRGMTYQVSHISSSQPYSANPVSRGMVGMQQPPISQSAVRMSTSGYTNTNSSVMDPSIVQPGRGMHTMGGRGVSSVMAGRGGYPVSSSAMSSMMTGSEGPMHHTSMSMSSAMNSQTAMTSSYPSAYQGVGASMSRSSPPLYTDMGHADINRGPMSAQQYSQQEQHYLSTVAMHRRQELSYRSESVEYYDEQQALRLLQQQQQQAARSSAMSASMMPKNDMDRIVALQQAQDDRDRLALSRMMSQQQQQQQAYASMSIPKQYTFSDPNIDNTNTFGSGGTHSASGLEVYQSHMMGMGSAPTRGGEHLHSEMLMRPPLGLAPALSSHSGSSSRDENSLYSQHSMYAQPFDHMSSHSHSHSQYMQHEAHSSGSAASSGHVYYQNIGGELDQERHLDMLISHGNREDDNSHHHDYDQQSQQDAETFATGLNNLSIGGKENEESSLRSK
jgi:hypothetical protein